MTKKKSYEMCVQAYRDETLSSGVEVRVLPFSASLFDNIQRQGLSKYPDPTPPKKIIKVVDGTEEIDDFKDPNYIKEKEEVESKRNSFTGTLIGEATIDMCLQVDLKPWAKTIEKLKKYADDVPSDSDELRVYFLTNYALRGKADYERVTTTAIALMTIGDGEIEQRMDSFRHQMEQSTNNKIETSSFDADIRVGLVSQET